MTDDPEKSTSRLGVIGLVTLIGSAFVGFNTLVTSCTSEIVARNDARLHAVEENEQFWTEAMQELSGIVKDRGQSTSNYETRCKLLARRVAPFSNATETAEANLGDATPSPELAALSQRVRNLQGEFATQIRDPEIVGQLCSKEFDRRGAKVQAKRDASAKIAGALVTATNADAAVPYDAIAARSDLITLSGLSAKGIDVDLFWCDSDVESEASGNFRAALLLGQRLAGYASNGQKLTYDGNINPVGRVRVRILPRGLVAPESKYVRENKLNVLEGRENVRPYMRALGGDAAGARIKGLESWQVVVREDAPRYYVTATICSSTAADAIRSVPLTTAR